MSTRAYRLTVSGTAQTTDGTTVTTVASQDISSFGGLNINGAGVFVDAILIGKDGSNNVCAGRGCRTMKRISGTLTALGTILMSTPFDGDVAGTPVMTLDTTGTTVRLRVTGVASTTIDWDGFLAFTSSSF